ncbi:DUF1641 domain-containing protein [uncultured Rubinisphaera sp.]|uniref:DUF1641 domain-containing protein n=1 Tax=uncultured Rubinisphaera sp. TaxID=1678686 RepID=UPI0030DC804A|tara:strand:+ start:921 stop:1661 length:741 start_codon:yes stop_codon:yes gene_type:complete
METTHERPSLADRLSDPHTTEALHRLLDRAESLDQILQLAGDLPNLVAIATDFFDAVCHKASLNGIDLEDRASQLLKLLVQITEPANLQAIERLISRLPDLEAGTAFLDEFPNLFATAVDVFDEWARDLKADGIDLEKSVRQGLYAVLYLGGQIRREELDRIGYLVKSDVMNEHSIESVGMAGSALASCRSGTCEHPLPKRVGLFGLLTAMRDPDTQRALSFGLQFAKCYGGVLAEKHSPSSQNQK